MRSSLSFAWILLSIALSGCAELHLVRPGMTEQVDTWLVEKEYGKVLEYIEILPSSHSNYAAFQARLPEIRRLAANFEEEIVSRGEELTVQEQWQDALEVYETGLAKLPNSATIEAALAGFLATRAARLEGLRTEVLLAKGDWLTRDTPLQREIARVDPHDPQAHRRLNEKSREVEKAAGELYSCGQQALARGEHDLALRCLKLAHTLTPTREIGTALARTKVAVAVQMAKRHGENQRNSQAGEASAIRHIVDAYEKAYANGDLLQARKHVSKLSSLEPEDTAIKRMEADLEAAIAFKIKRGIETGRTLYSRGQIQPAVDAWSELVPLEPDNEELNAHIARANRILDKLDKLKKKGASNDDSSL
jgi:tetratricopeptide (TPR) repeat protein